MRGATAGDLQDMRILFHFNPRAPCGARRDEVVAICESGRISIHAPHAGRDTDSLPTVLEKGEFQSTRPMRGATRCNLRQLEQREHFNPRAPCGARRMTDAFTCRRSYFNPRAPCGARPAARRRDLSRGRFQSTRPMRGATRWRRLWAN